MTVRKQTIKIMVNFDSDPLMMNWNLEFILNFLSDLVEKDLSLANSQFKQQTISFSFQDENKA